MSELAETNSALANVAKQPTAGMLLRQAREASGLHVAALAVAIKVPVKKLEALEADRLGDLPDAVFVRALAGSVCRALKIDPAPILSRLPVSTLPKLDRDERGINAPFNTTSPQYGNSVSNLVSQPAALWVIGLLVAALVVLYFPEVHTAGKAVISSVASADGAAGTAPVLVTSSVPVATGTEVAVAAVNAPVASAPAPVKAASESGVVAAAPTEVSAPPQVATADLLVFKAKSSAWVRVSDSKGAVQFEKTLAAGESATASGTPPLSIVVGNVSATELLVRGQAFNLEEVAKNNVARFEVK